MVCCEALRPCSARTNFATAFSTIVPPRLLMHSYRLLNPGLKRLCRNPAAATRLAKFSHLHPGLAPRAHFNAAAARLFRSWCGVLLHLRTALPVATQSLKPRIVIRLGRGP